MSVSPPRGRASIGVMQRYLVTIHYREPTYEQHVGRGRRVYRGSFAVDAPHVEAAVARAREAFAAWSRASSVSWVREEVGVSVREAT